MFKKITLISFIAASTLTGLYANMPTQSENNISHFREKYIEPNRDMIEKMQKEGAYAKMSDWQDRYTGDVNKTIDRLAKTDLDDSIKQKTKEALEGKFNGQKMEIKDPNLVLESDKFKKQYNEFTDMILNNAQVVDNQQVMTKQDIEAFKAGMKKYVKVNKEKIFIVLSSSMPSEIIKQYFSILEGIDGIDFVFRGVVGDDLKSFKPTMDYFQYLIKKDVNGEWDRDNIYSVNLSINPKVTRKYKINKVPALIYISNYDSKLEDAVALSQADNTKETVYIEYGATNPLYVLNKIQKKAKSKWLEAILNKDSFFKSSKNPNEVRNQGNQPSNIQQLREQGIQWNVK